MYLKNRFQEILFIVDTCEALTLFEHVTVPNVYFVGSSLKDQKATSYGFDDKISSPLSDRFTFLLDKFLNNLLSSGNLQYKINDMFEQISQQRDFLDSDVGIKNGVSRQVVLSLN